MPCEALLVLHDEREKHYWRMDVEAIILLDHVALVGGISCYHRQITCIPDSPYIADLQVACVESRKRQDRMTAVGCVDFATIIAMIGCREAQ